MRAYWFTLTLFFLLPITSFSQSHQPPSSTHHCISGQNEKVNLPGCSNMHDSIAGHHGSDPVHTAAPVSLYRQLQLIGASSIYTQFTTDHLPGPRGLSLPLGLTSFPIPWIERIDLSKGQPSVIYGFESLTDHINVELKKPGGPEKLLVNVFANNLGKTDVNINLGLKAGKNWKTLLMFHDDFFTDKKVDFNEDDFRDQPYGSQFNITNRWKFENEKGLVVEFGGSAFHNKHTGGQTEFKPSEKFTTNHYGVGINLDQWEGYAKMGYEFKGSKSQRIDIQMSALDHHHNSYFGLTEYNAEQQHYFANLIFSSNLQNPSHSIKTGFSVVFDRYRELLNAASYKRKEMVPGMFMEYNYEPKNNFSATVGIRADHNNLFGSFITPRLHVRYKPAAGTVISFSAGRGQRTANIFAENMALFVSARSIMLDKENTGNGYGFNPEIAWNKGISLDQEFNLFKRRSVLSLDLFHTRFIEQVVVDMERPGELHFYNLEGKSRTHNFQACWTMEPLEKLELRMAYCYLDMKTEYDKRFLSKPLAARHRAFFNVEYELGSWGFDYVINYNGAKRIPSTEENPPEYRFEEHSPAYLLMNAHISKKFGRKHASEFYIACENLGNYVQEELIIAPHEPFSKYFDGSLVWGPAEERLIYLGWRFRLH